MNVKIRDYKLQNTYTTTLQSTQRRTETPIPRPGDERLQVESDRTNALARTDREIEA